jgi:hypothetical protein
VVDLDNCPACRAREIADALAATAARPTGLPPELVQLLIEGTATGAVAAAKAPKKRKVSAYAKAYGAAYRRLRKKHTLKNGDLRKGYTHKRLVKLAHAEAKKNRKR